VSGGRAVEAAGTLTVADAVFERNRDATVVVLGDGTFTDVVIRDTRLRPDGGSGVGFTAVLGAVATVDRVVVEGSRTAAVSIGDSETTMTADRLVIRDTSQDLVDDPDGFGISVEFGPTVRLRRTTVERSESAGVRVIQASAVDAQDLVVSDTRGAGGSGAQGRGINVQSGSSVTGERFVVGHHRDVGVAALGDGTTVTIDDLVVADGQGSDADSSLGRGLESGAGATVIIRRAVARGNRDCAVCAFGSQLDLEDVEVTGTRFQRSDRSFGRALQFSNSSGAVTRARLVDNQELGAHFTGRTAVAVADLVIEDTAAEESTGWFGRGMEIGTSAAVVLDRAVVARSRDVGIMVVADGASLDARDLEILDTRERACVSSDCPDSGAGNGLAVTRTGRATVTGFRIEGAALCGVLVAQAPVAVDLSNGRIAGAAIGACVQVADYDLDRLRDDVAYDDNGVNVETTDLPVPDATVPL
jgi:hypothetical protein